MRCFERAKDGAGLVSVEREDPPCADGEVRVAVVAAAVSATSSGRPGHAVGGDAALGEVIETSDTASEWLGRTVVAPTLQACGECDFCRRGAPHGCRDASRLGVDRFGTLASSVVVKARWLAPADGDLALPDAGAALGGDALVSYTAFCRLGVAPAEPAIVLGRGARSLFVAEIARAKGAVVTALADATQLGALDGVADKPWRVLALDDDDALWSEAIGSAPAGSTLATLGRPPASLPAGVDCVSATWGHPDLLPELIALAARRELDLASGCVEIEATDNLGEALATARADERAAIVTKL